MVFSNSAVSEACLSERAQKMLPNEPLDVKKFVELAENEPLQNQALATGSLGVTWRFLPVHVEDRQLAEVLPKRRYRLHARR